MELPALSIGHALDVRPVGVGFVHSVFARAVNLEMRGDMWTLLDAERSDLPYGIRLALNDFAGLGLRRGDPVHLRAGFVGIGSGNRHLVVDCRTAPRWVPSSRYRRVPGLAIRFGAVAAAARDRAWRDSARMAKAVMTVLYDRQAVSDVLAGVVGRGPGSTPAGDDVLIGILAVLTSPHSGAAGAAAAESLRRAVLPLLSMTTDISAHLLRQAANGLFSRDLQELLCVLIGGAATARLREAVECVVAAGATSGADVCMGLLASAPEFLVAHDERAAA
jgi:hypothetical protein